MLKYVLLGLMLSSELFAAPAGFADKLVSAARERTEFDVTYDGSYRALAYPMGDVPSNIGVCTDLIVRAYRAVGVDLQQLVHEDMESDFGAYPANWGLRSTDRNIDHRRVPNLQAFFRRHGEILEIGTDASAYSAGDVVTWMLPGNLPHIGVVSDSRSVSGVRPLVIHNIGSGPTEEDVLFSYPITGHYRYAR